MADDDRAWLKDESPATQEIVRLTDEVARLRAENEKLTRLAYEIGLCPIHDLGQEAPAECTCRDEIKALRATQAELVEAGNAKHSRRPKQSRIPTDNRTKGGWHERCE